MGGSLGPSLVTLSSAACHSLYGRCRGGSRRRTPFRSVRALLPQRAESRSQPGCRLSACTSSSTSASPTALSPTGTCGSSGPLISFESRPARRDGRRQRSFFGRAGRMLASNQRSEALKFEVRLPVQAGEPPTAVASSNYHVDHFGAAFAIESADGEVAHSACVGFGWNGSLSPFSEHTGRFRPLAGVVRNLLWP